jgi:hypothetical protein
MMDNAFCDLSNDTPDVYAADKDEDRTMKPKDCSLGRPDAAKKPDAKEAKEHLELAMPKSAPAAMSQNTNLPFNFGLEDVDDFIATYGRDDDDNSDRYSSGSSVASDPFNLDRMLQDQSNALADEIQRELDEQIQQALQEQLDQQLEEYLNHNSLEDGYYYDSDHDDHYNYNSMAVNKVHGDANLTFLSERLAKAVRLEARVPTVAEINEDIQKIADRYWNNLKLEQADEEAPVFDKGSKRQLDC